MTTPHQPIRIVLIEDHALVRAGLRLLLETAPGLLVVGQTGDLGQGIDLARAVQPDIILLDINLKQESSLSAIPDLVSAAPAASVILLTAVADAEQHRRGVRMGAVGIVLKDEADTALIDAVQRVYSGHVWLNPDLITGILRENKHYGTAGTADPEAERISRLSPREHEVIALVAHGIATKEIARQLSVTERTIGHHLQSVFDKLGVSNRLELVIYAYRTGLAHPSHPDQQPESGRTSQRRIPGSPAT